ncbi:MAG: glycosyltransferase family 39 protein [Anaerolineales bacterium]
MPEPSVLDYLKALFSFGRRRLPAIPTRPAKEFKRAAARALVVPRPATRRVGLRVTLPWRSIAAFALFLLAQLMWSEPTKAAVAGAVLALAGAALAVWGITQGEWRLPQIEKAKVDRKPLGFRRVPLGIGLLFFALTFLFSGGNRFTLLNVTFWLLSILFVLAAFWQLPQSPKATWNKVKAFWRQPNWSLPIVRWTLVLVAAFAVIAFFRFSQLGSAPTEMTSDHAEKLLDVNDIFHGQYSIFFERNTGREPLQFYFTAALAQVFGTGISFLSLKLGTVLLAFISLVYVYLLGKELGGRWVGLFALLLVGLAFWPNLLARTGLRFSLFPTFAAPTLYYLLIALRRGRLNDFLLCGLFMGIGLNGYTAFRIMPLVAAAAVVIFLLHKTNTEQRRRALIGFALLALVALVICTPLLRYAVEHPATFSQRVSTRMLEAERAYSEPVGLTFIKNVWNGLTMFNYDGGQIWLVGLPGQPALDMVSAALFLMGILLAIFRYARTRSWLDLFLLISIPLLMLPSTLSLAFPEENPAMNRASGAWIPAFLLAALALDAFLHGLRDKLGANLGLRVAQGLGAIILLAFALSNYGLFFGSYLYRYDASSWNSSEMGAVIADYAGSFGSYESAWVVPYAHWVDTRLVGISAGVPEHDYAIWPDQLTNTLTTPPPKLFLLRPADEEGLSVLRQLYPQGLLSYHESRVPGKEFLAYFVPAQVTGQ